MTLHGKQLDLADWRVAILAGGLSTRLRPLTEKTPKALLSVAGEPFVVHQLRLLHFQGLRKVVLCLGYLGEMIQAEIGDGSGQIWKSLFLRRISAPWHRRCAEARVPKLGEQFLVMYGDSYMPVDYSAIIEAFVRSKKPALMTVFKNEGQWDTSNVWFETGKIRRYDKKLRTAEMCHIDYGIAVLSAEVLAPFPGDRPFDLADVYRRLVSEQKIAAYEVTQRFYEIGSREGLAELDSVLREKPATISP